MKLEIKEWNRQETRGYPSDIRMSQTNTYAAVKRLLKQKFLKNSNVNK